MRDLYRQASVQSGKTYVSTVVLYGRAEALEMHDAEVEMYRLAGWDVVHREEFRAVLRKRTSPRRDTVVELLVVRDEPVAVYGDGA